MTTATTESIEVMKINRAKVAACMTCPLCRNFFRDATTVSECLHTFCRECIYDKLTEDDLRSCPVCNVDLGCNPLDKLRADHNLQDIRLKIFPTTIQNSSAPKASVSAVPVPPRRKERSLSSLVIGKPKLPAKSILTGRRSRSRGPRPRKDPVSQESSFPVKKPVKDVEAHQAGLSSPQTSSETTPYKRETPFTAETSKRQTPDEEDDIIEVVPLGGGLWKPSNFLLEAARRAKANKCNSLGTTAKPTVPDDCDNEKCAKARVMDDANDNEKRPRGRVTADAHDNAKRPRGRVTADAHGDEKRPRGRVTADARDDEKRPRGRVTADAHDDEKRPRGRVIADAHDDEKPPRARVIADAQDNGKSPEGRVTAVARGRPKGSRVTAVTRGRPKGMVKEGGNASKVHAEASNAIPTSSDSLRARRYQGRRKRQPVSEEPSAPAQSIVDRYTKSDGRSGPIWFSLIASADQKGNAALPQIPSSYLRIKDGTLPVSYIQKYLVTKLNLASETEVEVSLMGQPLFSQLQLQKVVDWYVQTSSSPEKIQTTVGSSAKDFVMVLNYARRAPPARIPPAYFKRAYRHQLRL